MTRLRVLAPSVTAALLIFCAGGASAAEEKPRPLKIYVPETYQNFAPAFARTVQETVAAYIKDLNASGGLLGRPVEMVVQDDHNDVSRAAENAEIATKDPDHLVTISPMSSVGALHTGRIFAEANRLFFALFATSPRIGKLGPTVFQSVGDDLAQGRILASFACRQHAKRVVVLANRSDTYSDGLAREFSNQLRSLKECPLDGDIRQHDYVAGRFDLASFLRLVKEAKADLVFVPDLQVIAAQIVRALRIEKLDDVRVIGGDGWEAGSDSHDIFFKDFPKVAKQLPYYYTIHWHPEIGTAENVRIRALVEQETGRAPTGLAVLTWEVLSQVVKTVQEAGTADNLALTGKLRGRTYEGVTGKVTFGRDGRTLRDMVLIRLTPEGPKVEEVVPTPETGGK